MVRIVGHVVREPNGRATAVLQMGQRGDRMTILA
jgi:hypothetical protein